MTQVERIEKYIADFGGITRYEALLDLGILNLPGRIFDMRRGGAKITSRMIEVKNRYGETCHVKRYEVAQ